MAMLMVITFATRALRGAGAGWLAYGLALAAARRRLVAAAAVGGSSC